jgi:hypothetical protein
MRYYILALVLLVSIAAAAQGPKVYINGDNGVSGSSGGFALGGLGVASGSVSKHDETVEMARSLLKSCPEVSLTTSNDADSRPDYLLILTRREGYYSGTASQVMLLRPDKTVLFASKAGSVAHASKEGCKAIMTDWKDRRARTRQTIDPQGNWTATKP